MDSSGTNPKSQIQQQYEMELPVVKILGDHQKLPCEVESTQI
jgi:hypothetical protein